MRTVAFVVLLSALGGCARDPYVTASGETTSGNWQIAHQADRITGAELPSASIRAPASNTYVDFPKPSMMQITCFEKAPLVRFAFEFKIGPDKNTVLGYRFDDKPGHDNVESRVLMGEGAIVIDKPAAVAQFINELGGARKLYVRIRSLNLGRTTAEYPLEGSATAMQAALAGCPLQAAEPAKKRTS
ncbi:MAG: hypothetical protein JSS22_16805 [Proteobacteria bacterium]|nr:hypothetical protein [Pseudomonadota bacterium]